VTNADVPAEAREVIDYWFGREPASTALELEGRLGRWFGDAQVAEEIRSRFAGLVEASVDGGLASWEQSPLGKLALVIVLDQFVRSFFGMDDGRAFREERRAAAISLSLVEGGIPRDWSAEYHFFALIPLGHAEDLTLHERALAETWKLIKRAPLHLRPIYETVAAQLIRFMSVMERFGRFPHRNEALGRESTPEEAEFLRTWRVRHPAHDYRDQVEEAHRFESAGKPEDDD